MKFHIIKPVYKAPLPEMHKRPCKHCPSANGATDPECEMIKTLPREQRIQTAFACGWNGKKYCRGYCDSMGITNEDLKKLRS